MICPSEDSLLLAELGDLRVNDAREIEFHTQRCSQCRARCAAQRELLADLRALPNRSQADGDLFTARVMEACQTTAAGSAEPLVRRAYIQMGLGLVMVAAALGFVVMAPPTVHAPADQASESWAARGHTEHERTELLADVLYVREGVMRPLSGALLEAGDALAVRVTNRGVEPAYLAVVAVDAAGDTHWIYPAYLAADENPVSIVIAAGMHDQLLEELFEPSAPAAGVFRIFALWSPVPTDVRTVERHLAELSTTSGPRALPTTHVQQWRATWLAQ